MSWKTRPSICLRTIIALLPALALFPTAATAEGWDLGLRTGVYTDADSGFLGIEALKRIGTSRYFFNPNVELVFVDHGDLTALSFDVHYDLHLDSQTTNVWLGAGPTVLFKDPDFGPNDDDFGLNLLAGIGLRKGAVRPYGQLKVILADDTEAVLGIGIRFF